ncbi:MAG: ABC transporter permease [Deltaproteobacteria bacterium]|nr:ABC transporter permease [Deltaproteobacteria bacterium]MBN2670222.1 ABC transporter permease [Deltaproteobacteria bacterium]
MIGYIFKRLGMLLPTILGISLVTFILINLAVDNPDTAGTDTTGSAIDAETAQELGRAYGLHLPLFLNFSIEDAQTRTERNIKELSDPFNRKSAVRSLVHIGGAVIPYLLPKLDHLKGDSLSAALEALEDIARSIGHADALHNTNDPLRFWQKYWITYGSDFTPVRAKRLVRRTIRREDRLALNELHSLGTYCLPQIMESLNEALPLEAQIRLVDILCEITDRDDPMSPYFSLKQRRDVLSRWNEWWHQRYDLYTSFEGIYNVSGAITETRYFRWLSRVVTFDFGVSSRDGRPIRDKIMERAPVTLLLSVLALFFAYIIAIPLGAVSAVKKGSWFDRITGVSLFVLYSLPTFWVAMLLLKYFGSAGHLNWFPSQGLASPNLPFSATPWDVFVDTAHHLFLPVLCLSFVSLAMLARYQRVGMLRISEQGYIRAAKAKGLTDFQVILRHGLRNSVIPVITLMGLQLPYLISSSVVIERIFGIQGMGAETFDAIRSSDYYWLLAVVTVTAVLTMVGILASDVIYALVDPRIVPGRQLSKRI